MGNPYGLKQSLHQINKTCILECEGIWPEKALKSNPIWCLIWCENAVAYSLFSKCTLSHCKDFFFGFLVGRWWHLHLQSIQCGWTGGQDIQTDSSWWEKPLPYSQSNTLNNYFNSLFQMIIHIHFHSSTCPGRVALGVPKLHTWLPCGPALWSLRGPCAEHHLAQGWDSYW